MALTRYWFTFRQFAFPTPLNLGCGVTALNLEDARSLIYETVLKGIDLAVEAGHIENVDVSSLDKKHVLPNMGSPVVRGVWFPLQ